MDFTITQILLLTVYSMWNIIDELTVQTSLSQPVWAGFIAGLVMGDVKTGLFVGASLQLTVLGIGTFGGASKIDANSGTVLATAFAIATGMSPATAVAAIGVPAAALLTSFDILGRFTNTFFQHRVDKMIETFNYKGIERNYLYGIFPWALSRGIPVFLSLSLGKSAVQTMVDYMNTNLTWLSNGLQTAGAVLPAVGFAILLHYLPVKKHVAYLILGFTITALMTTLFTNLQVVGTSLGGLDKSFTSVFNAMPMLAIALIGLAFAIIEYKREIQRQDISASNPVTTITDNSDQSGEVEGDEEE